MAETAPVEPPQPPMEPQIIDLKMGPREQIVAVGGTAKFSVETRARDPQYQWFLQNTALRDETNSVLTISPVTVGSAGWYHCVVRSGYDVAQSQLFQLMTIRRDPEDKSPETRSDFIVGAKVAPGTPSGYWPGCPGNWSSYIVYRLTNEPYGYLPVRPTTGNPPPVYSVQALWRNCSAIKADDGGATYPPPCTNGLTLTLLSPKTNAHRFVAYFPSTNPPSPTVVYEVKIRGFYDPNNPNP